MWYAIYKRRITSWLDIKTKSKSLKNVAVLQDMLHITILSECWSEAIWLRCYLSHYSIHLVDGPVWNKSPERELYLFGSKHVRTCISYLHCINAYIRMSFTITVIQIPLYRPSLNVSRAHQWLSSTFGIRVTHLSYWIQFSR